MIAKEMLTVKNISNSSGSAMLGQTVPFHSTLVHVLQIPSVSDTKSEETSFLGSSSSTASTSLLLDKKSITKYPIFVSSPSTASSNNTSSSPAPASVLLTLSGLNITEFDVEAIRKRHVYACHPKTLFLNHAVRNKSRIYVPVKYHVDLPQEHNEKTIWSWKLQETSVHPKSLSLSESIFQLFLPSTTQHLVAVHQQGFSLSLVNLDLSSSTFHSFPSSDPTSSLVLAQWIPPNSLPSYSSASGYLLLMSNSFQVSIIDLTEMQVVFSTYLKEKEEAQNQHHVHPPTLLYVDFAAPFLVLGYAEALHVYSFSSQIAGFDFRHCLRLSSSLTSMAVHGTYVITTTDTICLYELEFGTLLSTLALPNSEEASLVIQTHLQPPYLFSTTVQPSAVHPDQLQVQWYRTQLHWPAKLQWSHVLGKQPRSSHACPMSTLSHPSVMAFHSKAHFDKEETFLNHLATCVAQEKKEEVVAKWESLVFPFIQEHPRISMGLQTTLLEWATDPAHFSMAWISFAFRQRWWIPSCLPSTFLLDVMRHSVDVSFFSELIPWTEERLLETFIPNALTPPSPYLSAVLRQPCSLPLRFLDFDQSCAFADVLLQHLDEACLDWVVALIDAKWTSLPTSFFESLQKWCQQDSSLDSLILAHLEMLLREHQAQLKHEKMALKCPPGYQKVNLLL